MERASPCENTAFRELGTDFVLREEVVGVLSQVVDTRCS